MSNRCYLYLVNGPGNEDARAIAEGADVLPLSWTLLLGKARKSTPVRYQRVFGDNDSPAIVAPAATGLAALRRFVALVLDDSRTASVEPLRRYLEAMLSFLEREIAAFEQDGAQAWFSVDAEELTWMDEEADPVRAIEAYCRQCNESLSILDQLVSMPVSARAGLLDQWLCFDAQHKRVTDWSVWCWRLGLNTFDDPYFTDAGDEPQDVSLEVFATREERLPVPGKPPLQWIRHGGLWGLFDASGERALVSPVFTEVHDFIDGVAEVAKDERRGLIDRAGRLVVPVRFDHLEWPQHGVVVVWLGGRGGWFDLDGRERVSPRFDSIDWVAGMSCLWVEDASGFWRSDLDGQALDGNRFIALPHHTWNDCWEVVTDHGWGLLDHQCQWLIPAHWEQVEALPGGHEFIVRRDALEGVIDREERPRVPLQFVAVEMLSIIELNDRTTHESRLLQVSDASGKAGCWSLDSGAEVLPCAYSGIYGVRGEVDVPDWLLAVERDRKGRVRLSAFDWHGNRLPDRFDPQALLGKDTFDEIALAGRCRQLWLEGNAAAAQPGPVEFDENDANAPEANEPRSSLEDGAPASVRPRGRRWWWLVLAALVLWGLLKLRGGQS